VQWSAAVSDDEKETTDVLGASSLRKTVLSGVTTVASVGLVLGAMPLQASAAGFDGNSCSYASNPVTGSAPVATAPVVGGIYVQAGPGGLTGNSDTTAVGGCTDNGVNGTFKGGAAELGVSQNHGVLWGPPGVLVGPNGKPCGWGGGTNVPCPVTATPVPVGAYLVAQGFTGNQANGLTPELEGYVGLSNYDSSNGVNGAQDSNSGGELALDGFGAYGIPSPLVCGDTSGTQWNNTTREGCEVP
jgi:hypothetical protein